jgi:hypothetical protein
MWSIPSPAQLIIFSSQQGSCNTAMNTWRAQRDEAWKKYAGLM